MMQQRLTLRLSRTENYSEHESQFISVDLPLDATEEQLRLAFAHAVGYIMAHSQGTMDDAAELVAGLIEGPPPLFDDKVRSMGEQREERAEEQAAYTYPPEATPSP